MSSDKDFLTIFQNFVLHLQENLNTNSWKSAEGFVDGIFNNIPDCFKIRVIRKGFFFNKKYIICFRSYSFEEAPFTRWKWMVYEDKVHHEQDALLHVSSERYMKAEDIIEDYKENGYLYDWITGFQNS